MKKASLRFWLCLWLGFMLTSKPVCAQGLQLIHLINNAGSNGVITLNAGFTFTTSFKGINDVAILQSTGTLHSLYPEIFGGTHSAHNPAYVTNFVGNGSLGTGDGTPGGLTTLETGLGAVTNQLRFDFSIPLTPLDHLLITDVEDSEEYGIRAFVLTNGGYQQVPLTNWLHQNYAGETGATPDATWAIWDSTNGTLTASTSAAQNEPLVVLTPDRSIDRVVFTKYMVGSGSASVQFLAEPTTAALPQLQIRKVGTNVVVFWSDTFSNYKLYQVNALGTGGSWTLDPNPAVLGGGFVLVTNSVSQNKFYRLQNP